MNVFLSTLAEACNAYLALDTESANRLKKLQGKIITIELLPWHAVFQCEFKDEKIKIHAKEHLPSDTKLSGTPMQMLGLMLAKNKKTQFFSHDLRIEGNAELGQAVARLFDDLHIDWEEHLSQITGDVIAYHAGNFVRRTKTWMQQAETSLTQNMNEYLHEETNWFPTREALQDFFTEIDEVRMKLDRVAARIKQIQLKINDDKEAM